MNAAAMVAVVAGAGSLLTGLGCMLTHIAKGDVQGALSPECLALVTAGVGVFSPGLHSLKAGVFKRPS